MTLRGCRVRFFVVWLTANVCPIWECHTSPTFVTRGNSIKSGYIAQLRNQQETGYYSLFVGFPQCGIVQETQQILRFFHPLCSPSDPHHPRAVVRVFEVHQKRRNLPIPISETIACQCFLPQHFPQKLGVFGDFMRPRIIPQ